MQLQVSLQNLEEFAKAFWQNAGSANVFAFHGAMGAGKTTTIAALCRYKGVEDAISSPTFSIINEYAYNENGSAGKIFHIDLYRLKDEEEVTQTGVEDSVYSGAICFVEWPEKAPQLFDDDAVHVFIETVNENERTVKILSGAAYKIVSMGEQL